MKALGLLLSLLLCFPVLAAPLPVWQASDGLDDPHLGQVWDTRSERWLDAQQLVEVLEGRPRVIVGERHDHPDHHQLQLWLLEQLQARRAQGALVMEMLQPSQQPLVDALQAQPLPADAELSAQLQWQPGWDWSLYGPLVRWGLAQPQRLLAANLNRDQLMAFYRDPPALEYAADTRQTLERIILDSHCGLIELAQVAPMLAIQHGRDQRMAEVLASAPAPALLIAGAYHARRDLGAPLHWQQDWGDSPVVVLLSEVGSALPVADQADYVWLAPLLPEQDHCEQMRRAAKN
ncbi:ChaN family lipoprotein [Halopseudomonas sp.]|uniref:ChaN family lipoprotein n=1 Tax=Halopseudomonas sp. TaxID=2901191 RepID=UPI00311E39D3